MKVSLGLNLQPGPFGGGNQFGKSLAAYLQQKGTHVYFDLGQPDLDIIVLSASRWSSAYTEKEIFRYLAKVNPRAIVVHRINECDERKGTTGVNKRVLHTNLCADHTVFISSWLNDLFTQQNLPCKSTGVILNGADRAIFNTEGYRAWDKKQPLKLVTHHWGGNLLKGFDIYELLDNLLEDKSFRDKISFTYIGNLPEGFKFRNTAYIEPKSGIELASLIKRNHVYLTATRNEPAGMHHIEGAMCGLPLLYIESGALPEYCSGFGVSFTKENFKEKMWEMANSYDHWQTNMQNYPYTAERMCENYYNLFLELIGRRDEIIKKRKRYHSLIRLSKFIWKHCLNDL